MTRRIFTTALLSGVIAGLFLAAIQQFDVIPLILEAETFEAAGHVENGGANQAWAPEDGAERILYTVLVDILTAIGFALLLSAAFALRGTVDWRQGLVWGLAGFATFNLAPALGLPPELPGAAAAPLLERQLWWLVTVALTGLGLSFIFFAPRTVFKALGAVLIAVPHIIGAPEPEVHGGLAPSELAHAFVYGTLLANGVFWLSLGALAGFLFKRIGGQGKMAL